MTDFWHIEVITNQQTFDWQKQGDALIAYFRQEMPFHITQGPWIIPGQEELVEQGLANGVCLYAEDTTTKLVFAFFNDDAVKIFIELTEQPTRIEQLEPWNSAIHRAYERLAEAEPEHNWIAAIGYRPGLIADSPKIMDGVTLDTISIESAKKPHTEAREKFETPHLGGASITTSFPLMVSGLSRGYDWDAAGTQALSDLNSICALLSLKFDCYWYVRITPQPPMSGDVWELPEWGFGFPRPGGGHVLGNTREVRVPSWITSAWKKIKSSDILDSAVHAHRQGLLLVNEAPSLALVCFVSAIEIIGSTLEDIPTCSECGSHPGAARRFRLALKATHSRKEVNELSKTYELRSRTAHAGTLYGGEKSWGGVSMHMSAFSGLPDTLKFRYQTLRKIQEASKKVLIDQLTQETTQ